MKAVIKLLLLCVGAVTYNKKELEEAGVLL